MPCQPFIYSLVLCLWVSPRAYLRDTPLEQDLAYFSCFSVEKEKLFNKYQDIKLISSLELNVWTNKLECSCFGKPLWPSLMPSCKARSIPLGGEPEGCSIMEGSSLFKSFSVMKEKVFKAITTRVKVIKLKTFLLCY